MIPLGTAPQHLYQGVPWSRRLVSWERITEPLEHWATVSPASPFLTEISSGKTWSYGEVWQAVRGIAQSLWHDYAVRPRQRVAVTASNTAISAFTILALTEIGAVTVLLNGRDPSGRQSAQADAACARVWLSENPVANQVDLRNLQASPTGKMPAYSRDLNGAAFIFFTTGTTAASKAVVQSHYNVVVNATALARLHGLRPDLKFFAVLPLCYANGLELSIIATMIGGAHVLLARGFEPFALFSQIQRSGANLASLVPSMLDVLVAHRGDVDISALKYFISAAAPLSSQTARAVYRRFGKQVVQGYGLTETTNFSTSMPTDMSERQYRTWMLEPDIPPVGSEMFGNEVVVCDELGRPVPDGTAGEVCMVGHSVMIGYDDNPDANAEAFSFGRFRSGDIGVFAEREPGRRFLTLTGRIKNIVKVGGVAVSLDELDRLIQAIPGVREALTFRVPDAIRGDRINAWVVAEHASLTADAIMAVLAAHMSVDRLPTSIRFVAELPRTPNGKIKRP